MTYVELSPSQVSELREIKLAQMKLMRLKQSQIRDFGLKYYDPHPKQDAFHRAGHFKRRAVFAGNRFGKSDCGCAEDCAQALGHRPWYDKNDPAYQAGIPQRAQKILVVTTDWDKVSEVFTGESGADVGKMWKFLPRGFVTDKKRNASGALEKLVCANGSVIQFETVQSFAKNPQALESALYDVVHIDEPCPEKMYSAVARGLIDRDGQSYFTLTPLREPWIYDKFFGETDVRSKLLKGCANLYKNDNWSITGSVWDNPYLSEASIVRFLTEDCPEEERECRERGIPLQFAGLIYKDFDTLVHVMKEVPDGWDDFDSPPPNWPVYLQVDPHPQTPTAGLLCTVSPTGRKYVFEELWKRSIAETIVKDLLEKVGGRYLVNPQCDPLAFVTDELSKTCWADDFGQFGIWFERAPKALERGIMAVTAALKDRDVYGHPTWMFSPYLKRFLYEVKRWHWNKDNKPVDKDDHTLECLYRMVLSNPTFVTREVDSKPIEDLEINSGLEDDERWAVRDYHAF